MSDDVRNRLDEELSWQDREPVDAMVARALSHGRQVRRARRAGARVATVAVVGVVAAGVAVGSTLVSSSSSTHGVAAGTPAKVEAAPPKTTATKTAASRAPSVTTTKPAATKAPAKVVQPTVASRPLVAAPAGVPATTRGALQLLSEQLGTLGHTSNAGVASDGSLHVELYVAGADGTAMVRVSMDQSNQPAACPANDPTTGFSSTCTTNAAGDLVVTWVNVTRDNCIETKSVQVFHPDGSMVNFDLPTCLAWDGHQNAPAPAALTPAQAAAFAADPRWDMSMSPALVTAGAASFGSPEIFS